MKPMLAKNDEKMFYKYLDKATNYFEFGSGGSTYQASIRNNIINIYSVESDIIWHNKLKNILKRKTNIQYIYVEMNSLPDTYGYPGPTSTKDQYINYSNQIILLDKNSRAIDLILIDGRFRVACCLKCFDIIDMNCLILFDDFLNRSVYHIVLDYYDIVESTSNKRLVVLRKKSNCSIPKEIIEEYELIQG